MRACRETLGIFTPAAVEAAVARPAPPTVAPSGVVVNVPTEPQLQAAVAALESNTTMLLAPGTCTLTSTLYVNGTFTNVAFRGSYGKTTYPRRAPELAIRQCPSLYPSEARKLVGRG